MTLASPLKSRAQTVEKKYRVIQWGMGNVGTLALRHFAHNPVYEVVGALQSSGEGR